MSDFFHSYIKMFLIIESKFAYQIKWIDVLYKPMWHYLPFSLFSKNYVLDYSSVINSLL